MRTKLRQTNIQILNRTLQELSVATEKDSSVGAVFRLHCGITPKLQSISEEVKLIEKPKKARGAPKAALINTMKLLTG